MKLKGAADLDRKLAELAQAGGAKEGSKALRGAMRNAMTIALKAARSTAAELNESGEAHRTYKGRLVAPGFASRSLRIVTAGGRDKTKFRTILGVRSEAFYALQFLEFGTARIPARPWLEPAFRVSKDAVTDRFADQLRARIERAAKGRK